MKKIINVVIAAILLVAVAILSIGCASESNEQPETEYEVTTDYYGCPNSKRVKKLNLKKQRRNNYK